MMRDTVKVYKDSIGSNNSFNEASKTWGLAFTTVGYKEKTRDRLERLQEGNISQGLYNAIVPYDSNNILEAGDRIEWIDQYNRTQYYKIQEEPEIFEAHHYEIILEVVPNFKGGA